MIILNLWPDDTIRANCTVKHNGRSYGVVFYLKDKHMHVHFPSSLNDQCIVIHVQNFQEHYEDMKAILLRISGRNSETANTYLNKIMESNDKDLVGRVNFLFMLAEK